MNYIDLIFAIAFLWAAYKGLTKGFIIQAAALAALLLGIFGAIKFSDLTARLITEKLDYHSDYLHLIAFALTFVAIVVGVHLVARIADKLVKAVALGFVNRIFGLLFSWLKTAFIISIILIILNSIDSRVSFLPRKAIDNSLLYKPLSSFAPLIFPYFRFDFREIRKEVIPNNEIRV
jgi:membrane protein required for colicin V production